MNLLDFEAPTPTNASVPTDIFSNNNVAPVGGADDGFNDFQGTTVNMNAPTGQASNLTQ